MAIPFFIFAGELMFHGGIAMRLVQSTLAAAGSVRGGLGIVNVLSSLLFSGMFGSAIADVGAWFHLHSCDIANASSAG